MTPDPSSFVDVVFPASLETALTYRVPEAWRTLATPGKRVLAPLGRRTVTGYLVGARDRAPVAEVKELCEILDAEPLLDAHLLGLTRWVADYYLCPWGEVIRTALDRFIERENTSSRIDMLRSGRGLWKDRRDLPDFGMLRGELDRTEGAAGES